MSESINQRQLKSLVIVRQPWPECISRMQKQWLALHELCVSSATWNIAIGARNK